MFSIFKRNPKPKKKNYKYYAMLVEKAVPLARKWALIIRECDDPKRLDRMLHHIRRIAIIQQAALAKMQSMELTQ